MALPRIRLITLPSTIAARGAHSLDGTHYNPPASGHPYLTPAEFIAAVPELAGVARVEADLDLSNPPRGQIFDRWPVLVSRINALLGEDETDGVIVTHGTNVLEETAFLLQLTVKSDKPVVVVGAQRPFTHLSTDGPLNLVNAARVCAAPEARGMGVLHVMNDEIQSARDVTKTSTYRVQTFRSGGLGLLGYADPDRVVFYRAPLRPHTLATPFRLDRGDRLPRVDILYDYTGADGGLVEAALALDASGLVVAGSGAGALGGLRDALMAARDRGVVVVRSSHVGSGRVLADDHYTAPGFVAADNLNPQKARVLLLLALMATSDPARIQAYFDRY